KPGDAEDIYKLRSDEKVNRFLTRNRSKNLEEAASFVNKINRGISNNEAMYWAITFNNSDSLIGTIGLWNFQPEIKRAEFGFEVKHKNLESSNIRDALPNF